MNVMRFFVSFFWLLFFVNCADNESKGKLQKLADGVYKREGWIYDMKELPSGKNVIPFYTIGKLSENTLSNYFTAPPSEMGITLYAILDKSGENKNKVTSIYLESTASNQDLFKFPRCLSICPISVEVTMDDGSVNPIKVTYSRPNTFKMQLEDLILNESLLGQRKVRIRIPISRNNQNTTFEWFEFDFTGFRPKL